MTSHESSLSDADNFDAELRQLLNDADIETTGRYSIRWLDGVKQALAESWDDHSYAFADSLMADNAEDIESTLEVIQEFIQTDFERLDGLEIGDPVCIAGYALVMSVDADGNVGGYVVANGVRIRARVDRATIARWPANEAEIIRQYLGGESSGADEDPEAGAQQQGGVMGAALVLSEVVIEGADGVDEKALDDEVVVLASLHSEGLLLGKIIHEEAR